MGGVLKLTLFDKYIPGNTVAVNLKAPTFTSLSNITTKLNAIKIVNHAQILDASSSVESLKSREALLLTIPLYWLPLRADL
ncbi:MAG: hypothetical protein AAGE59_18740 [Cyanobacteria bacterium P01_F01_bin.86]